MVSGGLFTSSDLVTISRAACLAERLTVEYFSLPGDEWTRNRYCMFTRKEAGDSLFVDDVLAHVVRVRPPKASKSCAEGQGEGFGILLQDPNILRALLRSGAYDLWTLALFVLTHELAHIVRFRTRQVDLGATEAERESEEQLVHAITGEILSGVDNMDSLFRMYDHRNMHTPPVVNVSQWRSLNADLRISVPEVRPRIRGMAENH